jgi:hypothetical protein
VNADTVSTHFRWLPPSIDGWSRLALTTEPLPEAEVSSQIALPHVMRKIAVVALTMEVLYQLS